MQRDFTFNYGVSQCRLYGNCSSLCLLPASGIYLHTTSFLISLFLCVSVFFFFFLCGVSLGGPRGVWWMCVVYIICRVRCQLNLCLILSAYLRNSGPQKQNQILKQLFMTVTMWLHLLHFSSSSHSWNEFTPYANWTWNLSIDWCALRKETRFCCIVRETK